MPSRVNPPRLVVPGLDNDLAERRLLDVPTTGGLRGDVRTIARDGLPKARKTPELVGSILDGSAVDNLLTILAEQYGLFTKKTHLDGLIVPSIRPVYMAQAKDSTVTFGTGLTTIDSFNLGPFAPGVLWLVRCSVHARLSVDTTGFARVYARIKAGGTSVAGNRTGTVDGERSCRATAFDLFWGTGSTENMAVRGAMDTSTGFASASYIEAMAYPVGRA